MDTHTCVTYVQHDRGFKISSLTWNPTGNAEIAYCDVMGQFGTVENCIPPLQEEVKKSTTLQRSEVIKKIEKLILMSTVIHINLHTITADTQDFIGLLSK